MNKTLKKTLSIILTVLMIVTTIPLAFAVGDGTPLTIDLSEVTVPYVYIGNGRTYYDEDGYIITGENKNIRILIYDSCDITFNNMSAHRVDLYSETEENITVTLDGDNYIYGYIYPYKSHLTINGDDDDTLTIESSSAAITTGGNPGSLTVNGGKINAVTETTYAYPTINCYGGFTLNGGEVTASNNYDNVIYCNTIINGGTLNVISTSPNWEAIYDDIEIAKGALLTVSATYKVIRDTRNITPVNEAEENLSLFARFDTDSDFAPVYDIKAAIEDKTYAEIKVDTHEHDLDNSGKCACGYSCPHKNITDGKCDDCGAEGTFVAITMNDSYGDGWNVNAVKIEQIIDGTYTEVATATIKNGYSGTFAIALPEEGIYAFKWVKGSYSDECSFTIAVNGEMVYEATDASKIEDEQVFYIICEHSAENGICSKCGFECGVDFEHEVTDYACTVCGKYMYAITHQPTEEEPYVELNDDTDASYQWYSVVDATTEITDENASGDWQSMGAFFGNSVYEDGKWIADNFNGMQYYFMVDLEADDTINFEFASEVEAIIFGIDGDFGGQFEVGDTKYNITVEEAGTYWLVTLPVEYVRAYTEGIIYTAVEGQTAATLFPAELGTYACEVTFADGTKEMSETFEATTVHTCDFSGEWKYDGTKHWKECACGLTGEEANHEFEDYTVTTPADCENNAWETGYCECGATDEREVPDSAFGHADENGDYKCDNGCGHEFEKPADKTCRDCGRPVHEGQINKYICLLITFIRLLVSLVKSLGVIA